MLNQTDKPAEEKLKVFDYVNPILEQTMQNGQANVDEATILQNVRSSIRLGYPQMRPFPPRMETLCLVGSGPSLKTTFHELRELYFEGAKIVTMNGAYHWCLEHNIRPSTQIVLDARPSNARFLEPLIPQCRYVLASQCAPETWKKVEGRSDVWIYHAITDMAGPMGEMLDRFYGGQWYGIGGGVTVATRALTLLSVCGWKRYHLFGIDSCWIGNEHHAFDQPENQKDTYFQLTVDDPTVPGTARRFVVSPWHLKQVEDFLMMIRCNGDHFMLHAHGDGLIAYLMQIGAQAALTLEEMPEPAAV